MKHPSIMTKMLKNRKLYAIAVFCLVVLPGISVAQPAPPGPGNGGGNPDTPLGVPFDGHLNLLLLLAGVLFAVLLLRKKWMKKGLNNSLVK